MDLKKLREKLDDATFAELEAHVTDLIGQRDVARNESINGRKGLKEKLEKLEKAQATLLEKLGVDSIEEIDSLPDAKGAAEAAKQYGAQIKRLERQLAEEKTAREEAQGKLKSSAQKAAIADALSGHEFIARDVVETFVSGRLAWEGDDLLFRADDGKLIPVKDGVAGLAKARPELLKSAGTGGSGFRPSGAGGAGGAATKNPWAKDSFNLTEQVRLSKENPQLAAQMKASAAASGANT